MLTPDRAQLEALLFATEAPLSVGHIAELLVWSPGKVERELDALDEEYRAAGHALFIAHEGSGIRLRTHADFAATIALVRGEPARLTRPALEVLAIAAARKTVTRPEIERMRGIDSDSVVEGLLAKGLLEETGREDSPGRAVLYRVSDLFLEMTGVAAREDLAALFVHEQQESLPDATAGIDATTTEPADDSTKY